MLACALILCCGISKSFAGVIYNYGEPAYLVMDQAATPISAEAYITAHIDGVNDGQVFFEPDVLVMNLNEEINTTLVLRNLGLNDLQNISVLLSTLPAGVKLQVDPSPVIDFIRDQLDGTTSIELNQLLSGGLTIPAEIRLPLKVSADLVNRSQGGQITASLLSDDNSLAQGLLTVQFNDDTDGIYLSNSVSKSVVSHDEPIKYHLEVTNQKLALPVNNVIVRDKLPFGVRYMKGTAKLQGNAIADPIIEEDGRSLTFVIPQINAQESQTISYLAFVTSHAREGENHSPSLAEVDVVNLNGGSIHIKSNRSDATMIVRKDPINFDSHIVGRVMVEACESSPEAIGLVEMRMMSEMQEDRIRYSVIMNGSGASLEDYKVKVTLPEALDYIESSAFLDDVGITRVQLKNDGRLLEFELGDIDDDWRHRLSFQVQPKKQAFGLFETTVKAQYYIDEYGLQETEVLKNTFQAKHKEESFKRISYWARFPQWSIEPVERDLNRIDSIIKQLKEKKVNHVYITGHTDADESRIADEIGKTSPGKSRAQIYAFYIGKKLGIESDKITINDKKASEPLGDNGTESGREKNRRVDIVFELKDNGDTENHIILGDDVFGSQQAYMAENTSYKPNGSMVSGLEGVRLIMEDGRFVDTDEEGRFHFEAIKPGTHVIQMDPDSIPEGYEAYLCENNTRFARNPESRFVDVSEGLIWRANFHVRPRKSSTATIRLNMNSKLENDLINYSINIGTEYISNAQQNLVVEFADAVEIDRNSIYINGKSVTAEFATNMKAMMIPLDVEEASRNLNVSFNAKIANAMAGFYRTRAFVVVKQEGMKVQFTDKVDNILSIQAEKDVRSERYEFVLNYDAETGLLSNADQLLLDDIGLLIKNKPIDYIHVIGHSDSAPLTGWMKDKYGTHQRLSYAWARMISQQLQDRTGLNGGKIKVEGVGNSRPIVDDEAALSQQSNRRVEIYVYVKKHGDEITAKITKADSIQLDNTVNVAEIDFEQKSEAIETSKKLPQGILSHKEGDVVANETNSIRVNLDSRLKIKLLVDDKEVPNDRIGFRASDPKFGTTLYTFFGVDLGKPGKHSITLQGIGPFGNARYEQKINITRSGRIGRIRFIESNENIADGKTPVSAKLELQDVYGILVKAEVDLEIVDGELKPYDVRNAETVPGLESSNRLVKVKADGTIEFDPVSKPGLYRVKVKYNDYVEELKVYVKPQYRDWVLVGLAEGTAGYNSVTGNIESMENSGTDEGFYDDERLAFYAKGRVLGRYLLTASYDSDKINKDDQRLQQLINPDDYYTLYGDNSQQQFDAASREKLYVRLDADRFYALFGDYNTGLDATELGRYTRMMTGFKGQYESERYSLNSFAAENSQVFKRDEILGDGTSGLYRLNGKKIVVNSESVSIQVRDRFKPEVILEETKMNRFTDYQLDYQDGTMYFKRPIPRFSPELNPVYIVVDYETYQGSSADIVAGARGAVKFLDEDLEVGTTIIDDNAAAAESSLVGVDTRYQLNDEIEIRAEYAESERQDLNNSEKGVAGLAKLNYSGDKTEATIYFNEQSDDFGMGQQNTSNGGMRSFGADTHFVLAERTKLNAEVRHEDNLVSSASRNYARTDVTYAPETWDFLGGLAIAEDEVGGETYRSDVLRTGVQKELFDADLRLRALSEWEMNGGSGSRDYPTRHTLGADYAINSKMDVYAEYEVAENDQYETYSTRTGLRARPYTNTELNSGVEQQVGEFDSRVFSVFGLTQHIPLTPEWRLTFTFDQTETLKQDYEDSLNADAPPASGAANAVVPSNGRFDDDFWAVSGGASYVSGIYNFDSRLEYRDGDMSQKYGFFSSVRQDLYQGVGHAMRLQVFDDQYDDGNDSFEAQLRYSSVFRPIGHAWFIFNRTELQYFDDGTAIEGIQNRKFIEHLALNYVPDYVWQLAAHLGYKRTITSTGNYDFAYDSYIVGSEMRYDLTRHVDVGAQYHLLYSPDSGLSEDSFGYSVGFDVAENLWLSVGYNFKGFDDRDFVESGYTAQGPYIKLRFKFDQNTFNLRN